MKTVFKILHKWNIFPYYVVINGVERYLTESKKKKLSFKKGDKLEKVESSEVYFQLKKCSCGNIFFVANSNDLQNGASFFEEPLRELKENENFQAIVFQRTCKTCDAISYIQYCDRSHLECDREGNII